jgi:hypothetical protein
MADIKHLGYGSLAILVADDKQIVLGPRETKDISADELNSEGVRKALRDGLVAIIPAPAQPEKKPQLKQNSN